MIFIIYKDEIHIFHAYMAMKCVFQQVVKIAMIGGKNYQKHHTEGNKKH